MVACANAISSRDPGVLAIPLEVTMSIGMHGYTLIGLSFSIQFSRSRLLFHTVSQQGNKAVKKPMRDGWPRVIFSSSSIEASSAASNFEQAPTSKKSPRSEGLRC
jgi:hypothetical protein